MYHNS